ncbi:MAG: FMN-binding protein [Clostridiaceae bacterium]
MQIFLKIILSALIVAVAIFMIGAIYLTKGMKAGKELVINKVNLGDLSDGRYRGSYTSGRWSNELEITVKDHKIVTITSIKDVAFIPPEFKENLFDSVIQKQNTDVDVVSGATVTTKAYLKSIENALNK